MDLELNFSFRADMNLHFQNLKLQTTYFYHLEILLQEDHNINFTYIYIFLATIECVKIYI